MAQSGPETALVHRTQRSLGALFGDRVSYFKYHGDQYSIRGFPDMFGHLDGRMFFFELKVLPGRPTPEQLEFVRREWTKGVMAGLIVQEDKHVMEHYFVPGNCDFSLKDKRRWIWIPTVSLPLAANKPPEALIDFRLLEPMMVRR